MKDNVDIVYKDITDGYDIYRRFIIDWLKATLVTYSIGIAISLSGVVLTTTQFDRPMSSMIDYFTFVLMLSATATISVALYIDYITYRTISSKSIPDLIDKKIRETLGNFK